MTRRVPPDVNLVRLTGFGGGALVRSPAGFRRVVGLPEGYASYAVRTGYQAEACPGAHGPETGCAVCLPFHGVIAVKVQDQRQFAGQRVVDIECECGRAQTILQDATFSTCPRCGSVHRRVDGVWGPGEPPDGAEAASSGALYTPHIPPSCHWCGKPLADHKLGTPVLSRSQSGVICYFEGSVDLAVRKQLSGKRAAGLIGRAK